MNRPVGQLLVVVFLIAVAVNFAWEMAQSVLYAGMGGWLIATWRCFVASLGDGVIVLGIAATGCVVFGCQGWFVRPRLATYIYLVTAGIAVAAFVERRALAAGRWAYTNRMPIVPILDVGFVPVLQMVVLPPIVFSLAASWLNKRENGKC